MIAAFLAVLLVIANASGVAAAAEGYKDENGNTQFGKDATVTYNDGAMTGMGLHNVNDGNYESTYVSEDNPDLTGGKQFIQFAWNAPISIDMVTLYSQYCGTAGKDGQAPTEWIIQISKDGSTFTDVATVQQTWQENDEVQSKDVCFSLQEGVVALRVVISKANLSWNHYAIGEIEVAKAAQDPDVPSKTGDTMMMVFPLLLVVSLSGLCLCVFSRKRNHC